MSRAPQMRRGKRKARGFRRPFWLGGGQGAGSSGGWGGLSCLMGGRWRILREDWGSAGALAGAGADDSDLRLFHRAVVFCDAVVASVDIPVYGRAGDWRGMG